MRTALEEFVVEEFERKLRERVLSYFLRKRHTIEELLAKVWRNWADRGVFFTSACDSWTRTRQIIQSWFDEDKNLLIGFNLITSKHYFCPHVVASHVRNGKYKLSSPAYNKIVCLV